MQHQENLDRTIELLKRHRTDFPEVATLLEGNLSNIYFRDFPEPSSTTTKEHILDIYETRASIERMMRKDNPQVRGYDTLIPRLRATCQKHICISDLETNNGSFIVFTDFYRTELIGVLVSE